MHSSIVGPSACFLLSLTMSAARIPSAVFRSRVPVLWRGICSVAVRPAAQIGQSQSLTAAFRRGGNLSLWTLQSEECRRKKYGALGAGIRQIVPMVRTAPQPGSSHALTSKGIGSPAWIRTTIHGSKGRCPTIRRPGNLQAEGASEVVYYGRMIRLGCSTVGSWGSSGRSLLLTIDTPRPIRSPG